MKKSIVGKRKLMKSKSITIKEIPEMINAGDSMPLVFGQFLDDFYHSSKTEKQQLINEEPLCFGVEPFLLAMLAGTTEKLALDYGLSMPSWIAKKIYYLDKPYYSFNIKNREVQDFLKRTTPREFADRNVFVGENALSRC